jgi:F420-non-reducing hydrogenase small subunit
LSKKKIAIYTATGCRVCENVILDIHYQVNSLSRLFDIVFWPYVLGSQWNDFEKAPLMDICFFAGAVSTESDREAAIRFREKSQILIAIGACASFGGMPGLVNLRTKATPETSAGEKAELPESPPPLPRVEHLVSALSQVVDVDYDIPGCPPTQNLVWAAIQAFSGWKGSTSNLSYASSRLPEPISQAIVSGVFPPKKSTFAGEKAVCASCSRIKEEKKFSNAKRPYETYESTGRCLLEQGLVCQGIATREGCGGLCTGVGLPCRGCFGKPPAVYDPGAKMVSAISSTFDSEKAGEIKKIVEKFHDLTGTFYRYNLPSQCELLRALRGNL